MELLEFVVDQFVWILLVLSPHQLPGSLHPQQIMYSTVVTHYIILQIHKLFPSEPVTFLGHFLYPWKLVPMNIKFFHINKILFILILIRNLNVKMQGIYRYMINEQNYLRSLIANHYFNVF